MKRIIFLLVAALAGCASTSAVERYQQEISQYAAAAWPNTGLTVPLPIFWSHSSDIAGKYNRSQEQEFFTMMSLEAAKKEAGLPNQYDRLDQQSRSGNTSVFNEAARYFIDLSAKNQCSSFGYAKDTADYNKCVFDVSLKLADRRAQAELSALQLIALSRPAPVRLPVRTQCTSSDNQTTCTSQ